MLATSATWVKFDPRRSQVKTAVPLSSHDLTHQAVTRWSIDVEISKIPALVSSRWSPVTWVACASATVQLETSSIAPLSNFNTTSRIALSSPPVAKQHRCEPPDVTWQDASAFTPDWFVLRRITSLIADVINRTKPSVPPETMCPSMRDVTRKQLSVSRDSPLNYCVIVLTICSQIIRIFLNTPCYRTRWMPIKCLKLIFVAKMR